MEIFQTIWTALSTPNEALTKLLIAPTTIIELTVTMLLYSTVLNFNSTKKQKVLYVTLLSTWSIISSIILSPMVSKTINTFIFPLAIMLFFNVSFLKSIVAEIISFFSMTIAESLFLKVYLSIFSITLEVANTTPIYRITFALVMYMFIYILYRLAKHFSVNIKLFDNINKKSKILLIIGFILGILNIVIQNYVNLYYTNILPAMITILSSFTLLAFFIISLYSIIKTGQLQLASQNLEEAQLYNKSLKILHDNVRAFKHDFGNIVQAIGRLYWN